MPMGVALGPGWLERDPAGAKPGGGFVPGPGGALDIDMGGGGVLAPARPGGGGRPGGPGGAGGAKPGTFCGRGPGASSTGGRFGGGGGPCPCAGRAGGTDGAAAGAAACIRLATSAAALNSSSARSSAFASEACSAARRNHRSASSRSLRDQSALAVCRAKYTSSSSSSLGGGITASIKPRERLPRLARRPRRFLRRDPSRGGPRRFSGPARPRAGPFMTDPPPLFQRTS
jgi:hypothetical protein